MSTPDSDGVHRTQWLGQRLPHAPVTEVRTAATVVTADDSIIESEAEQKAAPNADEEQRAAQAWLDYLTSNEDEDGPCGAEDFASALGVLDVGLRGRIDHVADAARARVSVLGRALARFRVQQRMEREAHQAALAASEARVVKLEALVATQAEAHQSALADMRKAIASVELGAARDRALRRHVEAKRAYPHAQQADLLAARRKTDHALGQRQ